SISAFIEAVCRKTLLEVNRDSVQSAAPNNSVKNYMSSRIIVRHGLGRGCGVGRGRGSGRRLTGGGLHCAISTLSMRQPSPEMLLSLPILQRKISCFRH